MFADLSVRTFRHSRLFRPFGTREADRFDPSWNPDEVSEATDLADLGTAREEALGACRKVADLKAKLCDSGVLTGPGDDLETDPGLGATAYRALQLGAVLLTGAAGYGLLADTILPDPWIALAASAALGCQSVLGGSQLGEWLRELPARWRRRPWSRRLVLGLAMPLALVASVGVILLVVPWSPASFAILAVGMAAGTVGWLAADPDPANAALIADYREELRSRDRLCSRYAGRLEAARAALLKKIDSLALPEAGEQH